MVSMKRAAAAAAAAHLWYPLPSLLVNVVLCCAPLLCASSIRQGRVLFLSFNLHLSCVVLIRGLSAPALKTILYVLFF